MEEDKVHELEMKGYDLVAMAELAAREISDPKNRRNFSPTTLLMIDEFVKRGVLNLLNSGVGYMSI